LQLTCFFDSCHSGTVTRVRAARRSVATESGSSTVAVRRVLPSPEMVAAYRRLARGAERPAPASAMKEVVFSACLPLQLAYERDGQGDFTRNALRVLADGRARTNTEFMNAVIGLFGATSI